MYELLRVKGTEYLKKALQYHNNHELTKFQMHIIRVLLKNGPIDFIMKEI